MLRRLAALALVPIILLAACGGDDSSSAKSDASSSTTDGSSTSVDKITLGYSAWPGWFPLAVAEQEGIFKDVGLDVDLKYFADYIASIEAFASGKLDGNAQTLNDTMASVAGGSDQVIVITGDNSTGNDKIICDKSITSIKDLKGKTIAAEAGVVDHFLLVQGLQKVGLTEKDIDFRGVPTDAAAASFASGDFDCVGVFAPFWLTALKRPGSHELFTSKDFPGTIPDHIVVSRALVDEHPAAVQKLVDAWYKTLDYIKANPDAATKIMAKAAETTVADYDSLAQGTTLFTAQQASDAFKDGKDTTSLLYTARLINPFLVESGFTEKEAPIDGLFDASFTDDWLKRSGG
ncbi:MAG: NitT/TauT family transport system substrate-binding protein [Actinomycetota bacterium]|jgi:NitT/TauT family transport system substrate-binding protein|nr:NitT/TauT family transport system substrate-binding protein [Actinomycetota bacterium]